MTSALIFVILFVIFKTFAVSQIYSTDYVENPWAWKRIG